MRRQIVAANWKMNLTLQEGEVLVKEICDGMPAMASHNTVVIAPPFTHIAMVSAGIAGKEQVASGAQNCHHEAAGAYTGEVSAAMLKSAGVAYVIIGHSERRQYCGETDAMLAEKVNLALANGLEVIFCCGEPLEVRDEQTQNQYVEAQLKAGLYHLTAEQMKHVVIAYEPIWAIGTGRTASTEQAQDMHAYIRQTLNAAYGDATATETPILYGGSCKPSNAAELFACADVDGGLIGGASLKAAEFLGIISAMVDK